MGWTNAGEIYGRLLAELKEFEVTDTHLLLLRRMYVSWDDCEFGAPEINPKRPYGNSDVVGDIAVMLKPEIEDWSYERRRAYIDTKTQEYTRLHAEAGLALQICLQRGAFTVGRFRKVGWHRWEMVAADGVEA